MIMPGVQKPHWRPCFSQNACLERVQVAAAGHALDRRDGAAVGLDGEHGARLHGVAVEMDGARAALGRVAADVGARQPEVLADDLDEEPPGFDVDVARYAIDLE